MSSTYKTAGATSSSRSQPKSGSPIDFGTGRTTGAAIGWQRHARTGEKENREMVRGAGSNGTGRLDADLLCRALEIADEPIAEDDQELLLSVATLGGILCRLWNSAPQASGLHRQILAAVENGVISLKRGLPATTNRMQAIRQGLMDLMQPTLTRANVDSVSSRLVDAGFSPMAFIAE